MARTYTNEIKRRRSSLLKELVAMCKSTTPETEVEVKDTGRAFEITPIEGRSRCIHHYESIALFASYHGFLVYITTQEGLPCVRII